MFKIAQKSNVPIVVCSLVNSRAILHNMFRKHTEVWLDVLDVVPAEELAGKTAIEVGERVHAVMEAGIVARETEQGCAHKASRILVSPLHPAGFPV